VSRQSWFFLLFPEEKLVVVKKGGDGNAEGKLVFVGLGNRIAIVLETAEPEGNVFKNCIAGVCRCVRLVMCKAKQGFGFREEKLSIKEVCFLSTLLCKACCR